MLPCLYTVDIVDLAKRIKQYYFDNIGLLPPDKRFHFASRLTAWESDEAAMHVLADLKEYMSGRGDSRQLLMQIMDQSVGRVYAKKLRLEYFNKYPDLFGLHNALFRVRHLMEIYGIDTRQELREIVGWQRLEALYWAIRQDPQAIRILSRFAVDYIYLLENLFELTDRMEPSEIYALKDGYDLTDKVQLHLFVYLFTHSIIAETNFYVRPIPGSRLETYRRMLGDLESLFRSDSRLKLDTKFEFLVTSRICARRSELFEMFEGEAASAVGPTGTFIIDESVGGPDAGLNSFERSEHRNVLYIMSQSPYRLSR